MESMRRKDCRGWVARGACTRGNHCFFAHAPERKGARGGKGQDGRRQRETVAENACGSSSPQQTQQQEAGAPAAVERSTVTADEPPFVVTRPTSCRDASVCRVAPMDELYDFDKFKYKLPVQRPPAAGYCHSSVLRPAGL